MRASLPETEEETIALINRLRVRTSNYGEVQIIDLSQPFYLLPLRSEQEYEREIIIRRSILGDF